MVWKSATFVATALLALAPLDRAADAAELTLPGQLAWTAYDTGSAGYNRPSPSARR